MKIDNNFERLISFGIPNNLRDFIWECILNERYNKNREYIYDKEKQEYYSAIKNSKNNKQIEKDIERTFTKEQGSLNLNILNNVLKSISGNKYIDGYCQGINFIVGFLLKITKFDEIKTYYILKSILIDIKGLFEDGFPLLKKYTIVFNIFPEAKHCPIKFLFFGYLNSSFSPFNIK